MCIKITHILEINIQENINFDLVQIAIEDASAWPVPTQLLDQSMLNCEDLL